MWLSLSFPHNAVASAKYLHIKVICRTELEFYIQLPFNIASIQCGSSTVSAEFVIAPVMELNHSDYQIGPLGKEWQGSTSCLLIATFSFPCPWCDTGGKFPRSTANCVAFHHVMVEEIWVPLINNYSCSHWIHLWWLRLRPGGREAELEQKWETNWLWVKSLAAIMAPLVQRCTHQMSHILVLES